MGLVARKLQRCGNLKTLIQGEIADELYSELRVYAERKELKIAAAAREVWELAMAYPGEVEAPDKVRYSHLLSVPCTADMALRIKQWRGEVPLSAAVRALTAMGLKLSGEAGKGERLEYPAPVAPPAPREHEVVPVVPKPETAPRPETPEERASRINDEQVNAENARLASLSPAEFEAERREAFGLAPAAPKPRLAPVAPPPDPGDEEDGYIPLTAEQVGAICAAEEARQALRLTAQTPTPPEIVAPAQSPEPGAPLASSAEPAPAPEAPAALCENGEDAAAPADLSLRSADPDCAVCQLCGRELVPGVKCLCSVHTSEE